MPSSDTTDLRVPPAIARLVDSFLEHHPDGNVERLIRAYAVAAVAHEAPVREAGDPHITHAVAVAEKPAVSWASVRLVSSIVSWSRAEDTNLTLAQVTSEF